VAIDADPETQSVLIIGTYRSDEIDENHFLTATIDYIRKFDIPHHDIRLSPLSREAISQMIEDTVRIRSLDDDVEMQALSACVYDKTNGNAFFAHHVPTGVTF
jgi:predicted ATPase